jgi:hypothetical protein
LRQNALKLACEHVYLKKFSGGIAPGPPGDGRGEEGEGREEKGGQREGRERRKGREGKEGGDTGREGRDWAPPMFDTDRRPWLTFNVDIVLYN